MTGLAYVAGTARFLIVVLLAAVHFLLVDVLGALLVRGSLRVPGWTLVSYRALQQYVPVLGPVLLRATSIVTTRLTLLHMGYWWIASPEVVSLRRGLADL